MIAAALARHAAGLGLCRIFGAGPADALPGFIEDMPATPAAAVAFYAQSEAPPDLCEWDTARLRVIVRGPADADTDRNRTPHDRALAFLDAFHGAHDLTLAPLTRDEVEVLQISALYAEPLNLGPDASGQPRWSAVLTAEFLHPSPHREASVL